jgi:hypothetical protein
MPAVTHVAAPRRVLRHGPHVGHGKQDLAEDHARVAARAEQRAVGERLPCSGGVRITWQPVGGLRSGENGQVEVGPGVPVGNGEDVEQIDLRAVTTERVGRQPAPAPYGCGVEKFPHVISPGSGRRQHRG